MESFIQDLRQAIRVLVKYPGFTVVAVITLTLGVGANTAIFSVLNTVLLKPLPYPETDRLVTVFTPQTGYYGTPLSAADWLDLEETSTSFEAWGAYQQESFNLSGGDDPVRVSGVSVTQGVLNALGTVPARGRLFAERETEETVGRVAMVSSQLWRTRFGADPDLIGSEIRINRESRTVIGVLPEDFRFPSWQALGEPDVLLPLYIEKTKSRAGIILPQRDRPAS